MVLWLFLAISLASSLFLATPVSAHYLITFAPEEPSTTEPPPPTTTESPPCPANQVLGFRSINYCAPNCQDLNPQVCTHMRGLGCDPAEGYAFVEGQSGDVIPIEFCPPQNESTTPFPSPPSPPPTTDTPLTPPPISCPLNMVPGMKSISGCAPSCDDLTPCCDSLVFGWGCDPAPGYAYSYDQSERSVIPIEECSSREQSSTSLPLTSPGPCGANAQLVESPLSGNDCALSCDFYTGPGSEEIGCTKMRSEPGCDPLPGYAFISGQSGDAIEKESCYLYNNSLNV